MNDKEVTQQLQEDLAKTQDHFKAELNKLRTGRAHPSMIEDLLVEVYGAKMPLLQLATITTPEAQLIQIAPFDPSTIAQIATAIRNNQTLGFNPADDGRVIRIQVPMLTEERRRQIVKQLSEKQEEANIGMRQARHSALDAVAKAKKDKLLGEDDAKRLQKSIDDICNKVRSEIESSAKSKETEILSL